MAHDRYEPCQKCRKRCCLNCSHFGGALEFLPGRLANITCKAQPKEKLDHTMGDKTVDQCAYHEFGYDFRIVNAPIDGGGVI